MVKPKGFGQRGPIIGHTNLLFGISAIHKIRDVCDILESIAPNVNELHLFGDDVGEVQTLCKSLSVSSFITSCRFGLVLRHSIWEEGCFGSESSFHRFTLRSP